MYKQLHRPYLLLTAICLLAGTLRAMKSPETSQHFKQWVDPESGVISYVLQTHVATQQQSFYYINRCMTDDSRFLWFYCGEKPGLRSMGVIDFETDEIRYFPDFLNIYASPYVDPETGYLYWATAEGIYGHSPYTNGTVETISGVPECFPEVNTRLYQLVCHLTRNASNTKFFLDSRIDNEFILGDLEISTGNYTEWGRTNFMFNHAQFHPTNDGLVLLCREYWKDADTGEQYYIPTNNDGVFERLWLWEEGSPQPELIPPINTGSGGRATHEWWSAQGECFYYCAYPSSWQPPGFGIARYDLETKTTTMITTNRATHAHSSPDDRFFVFDQTVPVNSYRGCAFNVFFYNPATDQAVRIAASPAYNTVDNQSSWHPDTHPSFANDQYIVSTLNIDGAMNVLVTPVSPLIKMTAGTFTTSEFSNDSDCGISNAKTYTHACNIDKTAVDIDINGVVFNPAWGTEPSTPNFSASGFTAGSVASGTLQVNGNVAAIMDSFLYDNTDEETETQEITLTGLDIGTDYILNFYSICYGSAGDRWLTVTTSYGARTRYDQNFNSQGTWDRYGNILRYSYTAEKTNLTVRFTSDTNKGFLFSAFSNEEKTTNSLMFTLK